MGSAIIVFTETDQDVIKLEECHTFSVITIDVLMFAHSPTSYVTSLVWKNIVTTERGFSAISFLI